MSVQKLSVLAAAFLSLFATSSFAHLPSNKPLQPQDTATKDDSEIQSEGKNYFFQSKDFDGFGGSIFASYAYNQTDVIHSIYFGGKLYYLFDNIFRLGAQVGIIRPVTPADPNAYTVGVVGDVLARIDPIVFEFGLGLGYAYLKDSSYLNLYPQIGMAFRITKEFAISPTIGYLLFFNDRIVAQPTAGIYFTFGAF